jgi:uncharacterized DUF497 family protein
MGYNLNIPLSGVEWDEDKNAINKIVHHIAFEDIQYIFSDDNRIERIDQSEKNISGEEHWQTIGRIGKIFFVVYTERKGNKRIISARLAEKHERRSYMAIIKSTVAVGTKPPKDVIKRLKKAAKYPIRFTEDCPKSMPEALKEFAHLAAERDRRKKKQSIPISISQDVLEPNN